MCLSCMHARIHARAIVHVCMRPDTQRCPLRNYRSCASMGPRPTRYHRPPEHQGRGLNGALLPHGGVQSMVRSMYYERPREERHPLWVVGGVAGGQSLAHVRLLTVNLLARNVEGQVPDEQDPATQRSRAIHTGTVRADAHASTSAIVRLSSQAHASKPPLTG